MKKTSVALRLSFSFSVLIAILMLAFSIATLFLLRMSLNRRNENELIDAALAIQQSLEDSDFIIARFESDVNIPWYTLFTVFTSSEGNIITLSTNDPLLPILPNTEGKVRFYREKDYFLDGDLNLLYYTLEADEYIIQSAINTDLDTLSSFVHEIPFVLALVAIPVILISFLAARFITYKTLHPVAKMTEEAKKISFENHNRRFEETGVKDEFDTLAETFNELFDRLHRDYLREKQFTSDVSHELKTPLSVILGNANILRRWGKDDKAQLDKSIGAILSESKHMENIIKNLLQLSRLEAKGERIEKETVKMRSLFESIILEVKEWKEDVELYIECDKKLELFTNESMLRQVLIILVSNSIRYCETRAMITLCANSDDDKIFLSVIDNGRGIKEKDLPHVFDRFYRADEARTRELKSSDDSLKGDGSGLGLAIAKAIISSLGGMITAKSPVEKEIGTEMILSFPL